MKMGIENINKVVGLKDKMIQGFEKKDQLSQLEIKKLQTQMASKFIDDLKGNRNKMDLMQSYVVQPL